MSVTLRVNYASFPTREFLMQASYVSSHVRSFNPSFLMLVLQLKLPIQTFLSELATEAYHNITFLYASVPMQSFLCELARAAFRCELSSACFQHELPRVTFWCELFNTSFLRDLSCRLSHLNPFFSSFHLQVFFLRIRLFSLYSAVRAYE